MGMSGDTKDTVPSTSAFKTFIKGRISKSSITDPSEVLAGKGAIVQVGHKKVAVYKDEDGKIHSRSPVCRHMKCIVEWNDAEKTWDCPCHGSRFDCEGRVLHGPAVRDLHHRGD
jgi:Rieske Fe-S protein